MPFFRHVTVYRFAPGVCPRPTPLARALATVPLRETLAAHESLSCGFVSPRGDADGSLAISDGVRTFLCLGTIEKILPPAAVRYEVDRRLAAQKAEGESARAMTRRRLVEAVNLEFLARAFPKFERTLAFLDAGAGWLVIDTGSKKVAERLVEQLRKALGSFRATPPASAVFPRAALTGWLNGNALPPAFALATSCDLKDPGDDGAKWSGRNTDLSADNTRAHVADGLMVGRLGLLFDGRVFFTLGADLTVRDIEFMAVPLDDEDEPEIFGAHLSAMARTLTELLEALAREFAIAREPVLTLDGGDASRDMRKREADHAASRARHQAMLDAVVQAFDQAALQRPGGAPADDASGTGDVARLVRTGTIALRMQSMREDVRARLGKDYPSRISAVKLSIEAEARTSDTGILESAIRLGKEASPSGATILMAAACELIDAPPARDKRRAPANGDATRVDQRQNALGLGE